MRGDPCIDCNRIAAGLYKRATALVQRQLAQHANGASNGQVAAAPAPAPAPAQAEPEAPTAPLPEAPVSITLKATRHGHEVMVTLRGMDFASVKAQVEHASEWLKVQAPAQPPTQGAGQADPSQQPGWCAKHGVPMKLNHKDGRSWWSHKTVAGWCKGR